MSRLRQGVRAFGWSAAGELGSRVLGPLAFLVLARVLRPEDFGIVASATVMISLAQALADLGLGKALVQREGNVEVAAATMLRLTAAIGVALTAMLLLLAPVIAGFFGDARVAPALRGLSPMLLLGALAAVPLALMQRELRFRELFWVRLASGALPPLLSVPMALLLPAGRGWWALVLGTLLGQAAQLVVAWMLLGGRQPRGGFDRDVARELLAFGRWALLSSLFAWSYGWLDALVVGRALGAHDMGLYRTGQTLVALVFGLVFTPLMPVLYSLFSRAQGEAALLRESLVTIINLAALVALPLALGMFLAADFLARLLLGPQWQGAGLVIGVLALAQGAAWLVAFNGEVYRAIGRPAVEAAVMGPVLLLYAAGYMVAVEKGLETFLWARLALTWLGIAVQVAATVWVLRVRGRDWAAPLASTMAFTGLAFVLSGRPLALQLLAWALATTGAVMWQGKRMHALVERWRLARTPVAVAQTGSTAPRVEAD